MYKALLLCLTILFVTGTSAQAQITEATTSQMYEIAYKGMAVTVDADMADWADAQWIFLSQDKVNFLKANGNPAIQGTPESPADFSGYFAMKMDDEAVYFAAIVRDEGTPMIDTPATPNLSFNYDHLSVYLGLYDIGTRPGSPHVEGPGEFEFYKPRDTPQVGDTITAGRTYRIKPGTDNTSSTLGADYQLLFRAVEYTSDGSPTAGDAARAFNYAGALIDTTLGGTVGASRLFEDETGYYLEWKVPFANLAGAISKPSREYKLFEWPMFEPMDGMVIVFDADLTDLDVGDEGLNRYLRIGDLGSLWRDSKSFSQRGRIVDLSKEGNFAPGSRYFIDYKASQNVTIDGDANDWRDAQFIGLSQDKPGFYKANGNPNIQGEPESPADFSGYIAVKLDDENMYAAMIIRDEGTPLIDTPDTPNLGFNYDHLSLYFGSYDITGLPTSPHTEGWGGTAFNFVDPVADTVLTVSGGSAYRIRPDADDTETTLGPDFQVIIRALEYGDGAGSSVVGDAVQTYNGGRVDTTIQNTVASSRLFDDETGYVLEWQVPLSELSGNIANALTRAVFKRFAWPALDPMPGMTLSFDADITDKDLGDEGLNRFIRVGNASGLFGNAAGRSRRALVTGGQFVFTAIEDVDEVPVAIGNTMLGKSYPNPTTGDVRIPFVLPQAERARLSLYNVLGQEVAVLVDGMLESGPKEATFDASSLPAGMYLYRLATPGRVETGVMTLVK